MLKILTLLTYRSGRIADSAGLLLRGSPWWAGADKPDLRGPQLDQAYAQRDRLAWAEAAHIAGPRDPVSMVIIPNDDSAGFYDCVPRCPDRAGYIRGDHSAGTAGRSITAIVAAVQLGNRYPPAGAGWFLGAAEAVPETSGVRRHTQ